MMEIQINNVDELFRRINEFPNNFLYRGQANSAWPLQSSLERILGHTWANDTAQSFEDFSLMKFKSKFHLYDRENIQPTSKLSWLSLMQHYGVPTRLLDFSESPYIALYFALESYNPQLGYPFSLFAIDYSSTLTNSIEHIKKIDSGFKETIESINEKKDQIFDETVDRFCYDIIWVTEPILPNARLDRQAGSFLLSGNRGKRIEEVLSSQVYKDVEVYKFIIPSDLYSGVFAALRKMNITSKTLYGDLDGVARGIKMEMQVYSSVPTKNQPAR